MKMKFKPYVPGTLKSGDEIWFKDAITEEYSNFTFLQDLSEEKHGQQKVKITSGRRVQIVPVFTVFVQI